MRRLILILICTKTFLYGQINHIDDDFFEIKIRPVLIDRCYSCHSTEGDKIKAGLLLDTKDGLLRGGDSGPALVPHNAEASLLYQLIRGDDPDRLMPPKGKELSQDQVLDFKRWIDAGAPDPRLGKSITAFEHIQNQGREHWAFKPIPQHSTDPQSLDSNLYHNMKDKNLSFSKLASATDLARRASFALTGLPPKMSDIEELNRNPGNYQKLIHSWIQSRAFGEKWARMWMNLARYSDTTGNKNAGLKRRSIYPYAWGYRDWLIEAFQNNMPYDKFVSLQLAADKMPEAQKKPKHLSALAFINLTPQVGSEHDQIDDKINTISRSFMGLSTQCARCHDHKFDPISIKDYYSFHGVLKNSIRPKEDPIVYQRGTSDDQQKYRQLIQSYRDKINEFKASEISRVQAGMLEHDGKYFLLAEMIKSKKAKSLLSESQSIAKIHQVDPMILNMWAESLSHPRNAKDPILRPWLDATTFDKNASFVEQFKQRLLTLSWQNTPEIFLKSWEEKTPHNLEEMAKSYGEIFERLSNAVNAPAYKFDIRERGTELPILPQIGKQKLDNPELETLRKIVFNPQGGWIQSDDNYLNTQLLATGYGRALQNLSEPIYSLSSYHPGAPLRAMSLLDHPHPSNSHVFVRGEPSNKGDLVERGFLSFFTYSDLKIEGGSGRLHVAQQITHRDNPLTARVWINRIWMEIFGKSLVSDPHNWGLTTPEPLQLDTLNFLSRELIEKGWDTRHIIQLILNSKVFQQSSYVSEELAQLDPQNDYYSVFPSRRLSYEEIRDSVLQVSGRLQATQSGQAPFFSESFVGDRSGDVSMYSNLKLPYKPRRSIYGFVDRKELPYMAKFFDFSDPNASAGQRSTTLVTQQSLYLMNSQFITREIQYLVNSMMSSENNEPEVFIEKLFRRMLGRIPNSSEMNTLREHLKQWEGNKVRWRKKVKDLTPTVGPHLEKALEVTNKLLPREELAQALLMHSEFLTVN